MLESETRLAVATLGLDPALDVINWTSREKLRRQRLYRTAGPLLSADESPQFASRNCPELGKYRRTCGRANRSDSMVNYDESSRRSPGADEKAQTVEHVRYADRASVSGKVSRPF